MTNPRKHTNNRNEYNGAFFKKKHMKKTTKQRLNKATAKPSGRKKLAVKALKNERKNKQSHENFNSFQEIYPLLSLDLKNIF